MVSNRKKPQVPAQVKPTNRRQFVAWLKYTLAAQGVPPGATYHELQAALERHGLKAGDQR